MPLWWAEHGGEVAAKLHGPRDVTGVPGPLLMLLVWGTKWPDVFMPLVLKTYFIYQATIRQVSDAISDGDTWL